MTNSNATPVLAWLKNLPSFPPVANKVMILLARKQISFREVAEVMKTDAGMSAEVLRLANSAAAGARYRVNSILEALALVGTQRLVGLLMTLSLSKMLRRSGSSAMMRRSWRHSLASALAAREFASAFDCDAEEAYMAGLFHDIGRLALLVMQPESYERLVAEEGDLRSLETAYFGLDHCEAGALVVEQWKLPSAYAEVARHHHEPGLEGDKLIRVVNAACVVANQLGFSVRPTLEAPDMNDKLGFSIAETINLLECEHWI